jgi:rhodanese-related sulfurtransferase
MRCTGSRPVEAVHDNRRVAYHDVIRYNGTMVATITPAKVSELLSNPNAQLIDVRDYQEWAGGHVEGARSLPLDQLRADPERALPPEATLIFICAKGQRSLTAAKLVERLGYQNIYNVDGGTAAWARAGLPLVAERAAA